MTKPTTFSVFPEGACPACETGSTDIRTWKLIHPIIAFGIPGGMRVYEVTTSLTGRIRTAFWMCFLRLKAAASFVLAPAGARPTLLYGSGPLCGSALSSLLLEKISLSSSGDRSPNPNGFGTAPSRKPKRKARNSSTRSDVSSSMNVTSQSLQEPGSSSTVYPRIPALALAGPWREAMGRKKRSGSSSAPSSSTGTSRTSPRKSGSSTTKDA